MATSHQTNGHRTRASGSSAPLTPDFLANLSPELENLADTLTSLSAQAQRFIRARPTFAVLIGLGLGLGLGRLLSRR